MLDAKYRLGAVACSFLIFVPMYIAAFIYNSVPPAQCALPCMALTIIVGRLCLRKVRILSLLSTLLLMFLINLSITAAVYAMFSLPEPIEEYVELFIIAVTVCVFMCCCFTKLRIRIKHLLEWTPRYIKRVVLAILLCCTMLLVFLLTSSVFVETTVRFFAMKCLMIILVFMLIFAMPVIITYYVSYKNMMKLAEKYEKQIKAQSEQYVSLSEANYEIRRFRHDQKNLMIGLEGLIKEGKNEDVIKMLKTQSEMLQPFTIPYDTGNGVVDAILNDKQKKAESFNSTIKFEGAVPPDRIDPADLCIIFGNTLDNSIEACSKLDAGEEKVIKVESVCCSGFIFVTITNPVSEKVELRNGYPVTTKSDKNKHGFGIYSLNNVVNRHDGTLTFECTDSVFKVSIEFSLS